MKTLLTNKQVYKIHKGDNHSARTRVKIGDQRKIRRHLLKKTYFLAEKIIFKINTCPHCGSKNSYHQRAQEVYSLDNSRKYDNVYKAETTFSEDTRLYHKIDYCLDCHKEFSIEMFIWKRYRKKGEGERIVRFFP